MIQVPVIIGKLFTTFSKLTNRGSGSTWPGHIALKLNPDFLSDFLQKNKIEVILVVGTNGKTTTSSMITHILRENGKKVFQNTSGANLQNGLASSFIKHSNLFGQTNKQYAVFEVDENNLPFVLKSITPHTIAILNLFRDQLDRYGELDAIAKKWSQSLQALPATTNIIINADDPLVASLGQKIKAKVYYYGLREKLTHKNLQHASDSAYCPLCQTKLTYKQIYYSHLGDWYCKNCLFKRPKLDLSKSIYPLPGTYNKYNSLAATLVAQTELIIQKNIENSLKSFSPSFGRQEKLTYNGKNIQIFLSKNPTSFNQSLETISNLKPKTQNLLLVLNDRIPDGRDVSWIWDVDFEQFLDKFEKVTVAGDRVYDLALRLQYADTPQKKTIIEPILQSATTKAVDQTPENQTLFILPTYSAMLEVRKILTGRKLL